MNRKIADEKDRRIWRELCDESPFGGFWAGPEWANALCDSYSGYEDVSRIMRIGSALVVVPLISLSKKLGRWRSVESMPLGQYGGFFSDSVLSADLIARAISFLQKTAITSATIHLPWWQSDFEIPEGVEASGGYTHVLALPGDEKTLWQNCYTTKCRNKIRGSADANIRVAAMSPESAVPKIEGIEAKWKLAKGIGEHYPKKLFERIAALSERRCRCYIAQVDGAAIAGMIVFHDAHRAYSFITVDDGEHRALHPVNALVHAALQDAVILGKSHFDFGQSLGIESLESFKESFGAKRTETTTLRIYGNFYRKIKGRR